MRPTAAAGASTTGETGPDAQLEHLFEIQPLPDITLTPWERASPNFVALRRWIRVNRPDLYERLPHDDLVAGLVILNAETGLAIAEGDVIETSAPLILAALQAKLRATP